jgi:hypothetical protein
MLLFSLHTHGLGNFYGEVCNLVGNGMIRFACKTPKNHQKQTAGIVTVIASPGPSPATTKVGGTVKEVTSQFFAIFSRTDTNLHTLARYYYNVKARPS